MTEIGDEGFEKGYCCDCRKTDVGEVRLIVGVWPRCKDCQYGKRKAQWEEANGIESEEQYKAKLQREWELKKLAEEGDVECDKCCRVHKASNEQEVTYCSVCDLWFCYDADYNCLKKHLPYCVQYEWRGRVPSEILEMAEGTVGRG